ncbi:MAG: hypothetical protein HY847_04530 [Betaproteobacteria bacterium]|nr:hypothetical protein [Betaproteobacteria bacterium]
MTIKHCAACGKKFEPRPQARNQTYCSAKECQRERRRNEQNLRRQTKQVSVSNSRNNKDRAGKNAKYMSNYRNRNPAYADANRKLQAARNQKRRATVIVNEAASAPSSPLPSGRYRLKPILADGIVSEASWIVEITIISGGS